MANWNPVEKPYRVSVARRSGVYGCHGWNTNSKTFATLEEAEQAAANIPVRGVIDVRIDRAENAETWTRNGKWQKITTLKPTKEPAQ